MWCPYFKIRQVIKNAQGTKYYPLKLYFFDWLRQKNKEMELLINYNSQREVVRLSYDELSILTLRRLVSSTYAVPESLGLGFTYRGT